MMTVKRNKIMKKELKNAIIPTGSMAATMVAVSGFCYISARVLTKIALDRKPPREYIIGRRLASNKKSRIIKSANDAANALEKSELETVYIKSLDGITLAGHWFCPKHPKRIIIAMHGWRSSWYGDFGPISSFWHDNDCCVLYAEQRAQGNSGGDYIGFGLLERFDCLEWIKWANKNNKGCLPIYLGGISMGASTVLMTADLPLPKNVKGIFADCGYTSPNDIWRHVVKNNMKIPYDIYSPIVNLLCKKKITVGSMEHSCPDALKNCKTPIMFIHGSDDKFVPIEMTYQNYKACSSAKRLFIVPGATHGLCYLFNRKGYEKSMLNFWNDYDS